MDKPVEDYSFENPVYDPDDVDDEETSFINNQNDDDEEVDPYWKNVKYVDNEDELLEKYHQSIFPEKEKVGFEKFKSDLKKKQKILNNNIEVLRKLLDHPKSKWTWTEAGLERFAKKYKYKLKLNEPVELTINVKKFKGSKFFNEKYEIQQSSIVQL